MYRRLSRRQRQPKGLCADLRDRLVAACGTELRGLRNRALITVGYDTLCRRSELVLIRVEDMSEMADGAGSVLIRRSKPDQFGDGRLAYLSRQTLAAVDNWLSASGISAGPMFRAVRKGRCGESGLHFNAVTRIIKSLAKSADLPADVIRNLSGHSLRIGPAIDMVEHGIDLVPIMHAGGWKSASMVLRYTQQIELSRSGMARLNAIAKHRE